MKKTLITIVATVLVCACIAGGTFAWLMDTTEAVENTFTVGMIDIELTEAVDHDEPFKMIPGEKIAKDPMVTVKKGSEKCWLFVKIDKSTAPAFDDYLTYTIGAGWTALDGNDGVYYRQVEANANADQMFYVLSGEGTGDYQNGFVTVKTSVTQSMDEEPTLTFTAYAIQYSGFNDSEKTEAENVALAWAQAKNAAVYTQP